MTFDYKPFWESAGTTPVTIDIEGFAADDAIAVEIARRGTFYEDSLLEHLALRGPHGGVFIDVGANIGNHAVFFGKFLADHLLAVEPNPAVLPILRRNLAANGVTSCTIVAAAAGAEPGRGRLHLPDRHARNIGGIQVLTIDASDAGIAPDQTAQNAQVHLSTLDEIYDSLDSDVRAKGVSLLKLDIEGMELQAIDGARHLLQDQRPQLVIELATPEAYEAALLVLGSYGYVDVGLRFGDTPTYHLINPAVHALRTTQLVTRAEAWSLEVCALGDEAATVIPAGAAMILVDEDQLGVQGTFGGRPALPFPEKDGYYFGHPSSGAAAVMELERLRRDRKAAFVVFTWSTFWWLDYYEALADHLRHNCRCVLDSPRLKIYVLGSG